MPISSKLFPGFQPERLILWWLALCAMTFSYNLGALPPYHTDESYYIESVKNMAESGDYATPVYHDKKRFAKPILIYWLMTLAYKAFGFSTAVARLWSVFFATLSVGLTFLLARLLFNRDTAFLSALILPGFFLHFQIARWATTDMALNFFILAAIYFFVRGLKALFPAKDFLLAWFCMGLGFMVKGPPALIIPLLVVAIFLTLVRRRAELGNLCWIRGSLILTAIIAPWFALMFHLHGEEFWNHLRGAEFEERVFNKVDFGLYFLGVAIRYYLPWSLFFLSAIALHAGLHGNRPLPGQTKLNAIASKLLSLRNKEHQPVLFCLVWFLMVVFLFTLLRIEHSRYILPASPAVAMIIADWIIHSLPESELAESPWFRIPYYLSQGMMLILIAVFATGAGILRYISPLPATLPLLLAIIVYFLFRVHRMFISRRILSLSMSFAGAQLLLMALLNGDILPYFNQYPMRGVAAEILKSARGDEAVAVYLLDNQRAKLEVLTAHTTLLFGDAAALRDFAGKGDKAVFVLMREADWKTDFMDLPLTPRAADYIWKKRQWDLNSLREAREIGVRRTLDESRERLILLGPPADRRG